MGESLIDTTYWGAVPDWAWHVIEDAKVYRFYGWLHSKIDSKSRRFWRKQPRIAEEYGVSTATISRWMNYLRRKGAVLTRYRWIDGKRISNVIELPMADPRSPACTSTVDVYNGTSTPTKRTPSSRGTILTASQPTLFDDLSDSPDDAGHAGDPLDRCSNQSDTGQDRKESPKKKGVSPTNRVMAYWLRGRKTRPSPGVIAGYGRAVKTCLESGVSEVDLTRAINDLMERGVDAFPSQLLARFSLRRPAKRPAKRDYEKNPLYKHQPKPSTMTPERKAETAPPILGLPQRSTTSLPSGPPVARVTTGATTARGPLSVTPGETAPGVSLNLNGRSSRDETVYEAGINVRHVSGGLSLGDALAGLIGRGR